MPYIVQSKRDALDPTIDALHRLLVELEMDDPENNTEGNLNYVISRLLHMVYGDKDSTRYANINDGIGMLECVKLELYRKVAAPYENQKEHDNGEIVRFRAQPEVISEVVVEKSP